MTDGLHKEHYMVMIAIDVSCTPQQLEICTLYLQSRHVLRPSEIARAVGIPARDIRAKLTAYPRCDSLLALLDAVPSKN